MSLGNKHYDRFANLNLLTVHYIHYVFTILYEIHKTRPCFILKSHLKDNSKHSKPNISSSFEDVIRRRKEKKTVQAVRGRFNYLKHFKVTQ